MSRRSLSALLVAVLAGGPATAHAEPTANEIAVARRLFNEATDLESSQQWAEAASKLRAALAIKDTPGLRFHLAHAEVEQGQLVEALVDYDRADELIRAGASAPDVVDLLADAREAARRRVATLALRLPSDAAASELTLDGHAVAHELLEQPIPLNPGTHHVEVRASGRRPFSKDVKLSEGERHELDVVLEGQDSAPPARPIATTQGSELPKVRASKAEPHDGAPDSSKLKLIVVVSESALAAAGLAVGIGFSIAQSGATDRADRARSNLPKNACNPSNLAGQPIYTSDCRTLSDSLHEADRDATFATVGFVGAGVAGAAALATALLWHPDDRIKASRDAHLEFGANATPSSFDLNIRGRF